MSSAQKQRICSQFWSKAKAQFTLTMENLVLLLIFLIHDYSRLEAARRSKTDNDEAYGGLYRNSITDCEILWFTFIAMGE